MASSLITALTVTTPRTITAPAPITDSEQGSYRLAERFPDRTLSVELSADSEDGAVWIEVRQTVPDLVASSGWDSKRRFFIDQN